MNLHLTPLQNTTEIFNDCVLGIRNPDLQMRLNLASASILTKFSDYNDLGMQHQLHALVPSQWGNGHLIVLNGISKDELVTLYEEGMVGKKSPGRKHYEALMENVIKRCPYCGLTDVDTLDHFASKARYPTFSVLSHNLIPSCFKCNKTKKSPVILPHIQTLHPYYEPVEVINEPWIYATITESFPQELTFFVDTPAGWAPDLVTRTQNHFNQFELNKRFGISAQSEIIPICERLADIDTFEQRSAHLISISTLERKRRPNSWKAALYEALAKSNLFITIGYSDFLVDHKNEFKLLHRS